LYLLDTSFSSENVLALIDRLVGAIESEMPAHCKRWGTSLEGWKIELERVRRFARERSAYVMRHLKSYFNVSDEELEDYSF